MYLFDILIIFYHFDSIFSKIYKYTRLVWDFNRRCVHRRMCVAELVVTFADMGGACLRACS